MADRFALSRYGLSDDTIDSTVGKYQQLRESGLDDEKALQQAVYAGDVRVARLACKDRLVV